MKNSTFFLGLMLGLFACTTVRQPARVTGNPLEDIVKSPEINLVIREKDRFEIQIIYTQIDRDEQQRPHFTTWHWNVDSLAYFYPASTVKMPLAFLALEKINQLQRSGYPRLNSETAYALDSVQPFQRRYDADTSAPKGKPTIMQEVRGIFAISDNDAYNRLFDFLGREYINQALAQKGYVNTGVMHRFYTSKRDQAYAQPIRFLDNGGRQIWAEKERIDPKTYNNPNKNLVKGRGYYNANDSLVNQPFDFSSKNWFALTDMERMLRAALFPAAMPERQRFGIGEKDLRAMHQYMGMFPREYEHPHYDTVHYCDGYVKFFLTGDKAVQSGTVRSFNKVGEAYGTLTDVAYVVDFDHQVEFVLAATILCNTDGIFNDDQYDYDKIGFPFLSKLGQQVLAYECKRTRKVKPDLSYWRFGK